MISVQCPDFVQVAIHCCNMSSDLHSLSCNDSNHNLFIDNDSKLL